MWWIGPAISAAGSLLGASQNNQAQAASDQRARQFSRKQSTLQFKRSKKLQNLSFKQNLRLQRLSNKFNRKEAKKAFQRNLRMTKLTDRLNRQSIDYQTDPKRWRERLEEAGYNPAMFTPGGGSPTASAIGSGPASSSPNGVGAGGVTPVAPNYTSVFGNGIADAAHLIGEGFSRQAALEIQRSALSMENERLTRENAALTLRPDVVGVVQGAPSIVGRPAYEQVPARVEDPGVDDADFPSVGHDFGAHRNPALNYDPGGEDAGITSLNRNEAPQFTFAGINFKGSGGFSSGATYEDATGELAGSILGLASMGDAIVATGYRGLRDGLRAFTQYDPDADYGRHGRFRKRRRDELFNGYTPHNAWSITPSEEYLRPQGSAGRRNR